MSSSNNDMPSFERLSINDNNSRTNFPNSNSGTTQNTTNNSQFHSPRSDQPPYIQVTRDSEGQDASQHNKTNYQGWNQRS